MPPEPVRSEIREFKEYALKNFNSGHALRSPAHITLIPPFHLEDIKVNALSEMVNELVKPVPPFEVNLRDFGCFPPRVINVAVRGNNYLNQLQSTLEEEIVPAFELRIRSKQQFRPHMTIAFRYPDDTIFPLAWAHFKNQPYERSFKAIDVSLLKHSSGRWEILSSFSLNGNT